MRRSDEIASVTFTVLQSQSFADWHKEFILWVEGDEMAKSESWLKERLARMYQKFD